MHQDWLVPVVARVAKLLQRASIASQAASATTASVRELAEAAHACQAERDVHAALRDRWDAQRQAENDLRARCTELTFELRAAQEDLALSQITQASQLSQVGVAGTMVLRLCPLHGEGCRAGTGVACICLWLLYSGL